MAVLPTGTLPYSIGFGGDLQDAAVCRRAPASATVALPALVSSVEFAAEVAFGRSGSKATSTVTASPGCERLARLPARRSALNGAAGSSTAVDRQRRAADVAERRGGRDVAADGRAAEGERRPARLRSWLRRAGRCPAARRCTRAGARFRRSAWPPSRPAAGRCERDRDLDRLAGAERGRAAPASGVPSVNCARAGRDAW